MSVKSLKSETIEVLSDRDFRYYAFCNDFGPVDINQTHKFCLYLSSLLSAEEHQNKKIFHFTSNHPHKKANAAYLLGAFCIIVLNKPSSEVISLFASIPAKFRDASSGTADYFCTLTDCFTALELAIKRGWYKHEEFSSKDYEFYSKLENGDLNWIIPKEFVAFSAPSKSDSFIKNKNPPVSEYCKILQGLGIKNVVRLNKPAYDSDEFVSQGLKHFDLHFKDGSVPSMEIVNKFIDICSSERGAIAVHCKAGLGRTGTLIACYAIKIFKFPAASFIAWCRLCRPGSILGPQQQFLCDFEVMVKNKTFPSHQNLLTDHSFTDNAQGKKLVDAKRRNSSYTQENKQHENLETPEKPYRRSSRFRSELEKLQLKCFKSGSRTGFAALNSKNFRSGRVFQILYGETPLINK